MASSGQPRIDYSADFDNDTIIIKGRGKDIKISLRDLICYKYDERSGNPAVPTDGTSVDDWKLFQKRLRTLDMIKDAKATKTSMKGAADIIPPLMGIRGSIPFTQLHTIRTTIEHDTSSRIIKTTAIHKNKLYQNLAKLTSRTTYKESGINPDHIIHKPVYCSSIATEVIDPLKRAYGNNEIKYFPERRSTLKITKNFLEFFGLQDCELTDTRLSDNEHTHQYTLQLAQGIIAPRSTLPDSPSRPQTWYLGNLKKNKYFNDHTNGAINVKKALLNAKELGDVLQVLIMFSNNHLGVAGQSHSMVTGDEIVFILCIQLKLDCLFYHHIPRRGDVIGEHQIYHYKGIYTDKHAETEFKKAKKEIYDGNLLIMDAIKEIITIEHISIELPQEEITFNFRFPCRFLMDILTDMFQINFRLQHYAKFEYIPGYRGMLPAQKISAIKILIKDMRESYKIKDLFQWKNNYRVKFFSNYKEYTSKPTPGISDGRRTYYRLNGYNRKTPFIDIYKRNYPPQPRQGGSYQYIQQGGVNLFTTIYRYISSGINAIKHAYNIASNALAPFSIQIFQIEQYPIDVIIKDKDINKDLEDEVSADANNNWSNIELSGQSVDIIPDADLHYADPPDECTQSGGSILNELKEDGSDAYKLDIHKLWGNQVLHTIERIIRTYSKEEKEEVHANLGHIYSELYHILYINEGKLNPLRIGNEEIALAFNHNVINHKLRRIGIIKNTHEESNETRETIIDKIINDILATIPEIDEMPSQEQPSAFKPQMNVLDITNKREAAPQRGISPAKAATMVTHAQLATPPRNFNKFAATNLSAATTASAAATAAQIPRISASQLVKIKSPATPPQQRIKLTRKQMSPSSLHEMDNNSSSSSTSSSPQYKKYKIYTSPTTPRRLFQTTVSPGHGGQRFSRKRMIHPKKHKTHRKRKYRLNKTRSRR